MTTVACDGGTKEVENNQEFDARCSHSQVQFFFFSGRKSEYLRHILLKSQLRYRLKLTTVLSNVGILTRAVLVDQQSLKEKERKDLGNNSFQEFHCKKE